MPTTKNLNAAIKAKDLNRVRELLKAGVPQDSSSCFLAMERKAGDVLKLLLTSGADLKVLEPYWERTLLNYALKKGDMQSLQLLLQAGASPNLDCRSGPPLVFAAKRGVLEGLRLLIAAGADPDQKDFCGCTALFHAAGTGNLEALRLLLAAGASPLAADTAGRTPYDFAVECEHPEAAELLAPLSCGKKARRKTTPKTPLEPPEESNRKAGRKTARRSASRHRAWRQLEDSTAAATFYLTGESVVRAATIPTHPTSKAPTTVRVTHSNSIGRVDSDVFVRLGDPKAPLKWNAFDTVFDWRNAPVVEDLLWSDEREEWVIRGKAEGAGILWSGTYETTLQFPHGHHLIEIKIVSRVPEVCSIVLNWKVFVR